MGSELLDLFDAESLSERLAFVLPDGAITFGRIRALSMDLAWTLETHHVSAGERVLVTCDGSRDPWRFLAALMACWRRGAIAVPLEKQWSAGRSNQTREDCAPSAIIDQGQVEVLEGAGAGEPAPIADLAMFLYTSGSAARPKGVMITHSGAWAACTRIQEVLGYRSDDRIGLALPLTFDYGLYQLFLAGLAGAALVPVARAELPSLGAKLERSGATVLPLVPSLGEILVKSSGRNSTDLGGLRLITNTGERMSARLLSNLAEVAPNADIRLMYGLTECKRASIAHRGDHRSHPDAVGLPLPGTTITIRDDAGRPCAVGTSGRICIAGPHVMAGYWSDEVATSEIFRSDGCGGRELWTEDLGHMDASGRLYIDGRLGGIVKLRDRRTSVEALEHAASRTPGVESVCVCVSEFAPALVKLFVTGDAEVSAVRSTMVAVLGPELLPHAIARIGEMPLSSNGKIDRVQLHAAAFGAGVPAMNEGIE